MHWQIFLVRHDATQKGKPLAEKVASRDLSLDAPIDDNQELTRFDLLKGTSPNQEEVLGEEEGKKILEKDVRVAMKRLNEKEEYVVKNGIMTDSPLTL
jgi:DNA-directed RNA polymerase sigma subunit (sigma70/sigma32)